VKAQYHS